ncbi:hypothetical protein EDD11_003529 [Mortierella claussenii]|nr:hypothetical protein EDD11_003529 [Mortierella claussenii]
MANLTFLLLLLALVFPAPTTASFGWCVGMVGVDWVKVVVGFRLWNQDGTEAAQYRSVYSPGQTKLNNNGWTVQVLFGKEPDHYFGEKFFVSHNVYGNLGEMKVFNSIHCKDPHRYYYSGCYDNDGGIFCTEKRMVEHFDTCIAHLNLGSESNFCAYKFSGVEGGGKEGTSGRSKNVTVEATVMTTARVLNTTSPA